MAVESSDEVARLGKEMYARIRDAMEASQWGRMVVIDVNSGDYEVADDDLTAILRLLERRPDAMSWVEQVGYRAPYYLNRNYLHDPNWSDMQLSNGKTEIDH